MILKVHFITAKHLVATSKDSSVSLSWKVGKVGWRVNSWEARVEEQHWAGRLASAILMLFLLILLIELILMSGLVSDCFNNSRRPLLINQSGVRWAGVGVSEYS